MSRRLESLPRSESKTRFMARLGLDIRDARHRQIYTMMKDEASAGRSRIMSTLSLAARNQDSGSGMASYTGDSFITTSQVPEHIMNNEILHIYRTAGPATQILQVKYELALDPNHPHEPNWIIRWMLWHVFRYRDGRQSRGDVLTRQHRATSPSSDDEEDDDSSASKSRPVAATSAMIGSNSQNNVATERRYDPVRDQWNG